MLVEEGEVPEPDVDAEGEDKDELPVDDEAEPEPEPTNAEELATLVVLDCRTHEIPPMT